MTVMRFVDMVQHKVPGRGVGGVDELFVWAKGTAGSAGRGVRAEVAEDVGSPFLGACEGGVAVEDVEETDVVVWVRGAGRGGEGEGA